jgi:aspartyl-tRNA(Asn)/glutamyl-tRNA(Gln) amidotransferase subunit B
MINKYETVIGLEIHIQLKTQSKMFCGCNNYSFNVEPNINTCQICMGFPGTLPVANKKAIMWTIMLGKALNGKTAQTFNFERKHYFYPDLPKAYQITSSTNPPVVGGELQVEVDGEKRKVRIHHIHLEEDAGKLIHESGTNNSLVDLNRAGTPLVELVTEPDIKSPKEARIFVESMRTLLRYLDISDANMEQGNLRCDANISLKFPEAKKLGKKVEIKNMNSFKMIEKALIYEEKRQSEMLDKGGEIAQETRGWDDIKGKTLEQRSKEEAHDYRYMPEPDIPPINSAELFDLNSISLPELPQEKIDKFESMGIKPDDAFILVSDKRLATYFENTVSKIKEPKKAANWILTELLGIANKKSVHFSEIKISPENLASLINKIDSNEVTGALAKTVFEKMAQSGKSTDQAIKELDIKKVSISDLDSIIEKIITANPNAVEDYKKGKEASIQFLTGQVMRETRGQANPEDITKILINKM